jgi:hypothetical protein
MTDEQPLEEEYREKMNLIAHALDEYFNGESKGADRETGFVLLVFKFGDVTSRLNYISNGADRNDIIKLFKELIPKFQGSKGHTSHE